jgi:DNA repair exonuclease SbcCD nuclease subunit
MLKILASADHHLGMKFAGYPGVREELAEARFCALQRLVALANDRGCALFLIAGDLFDRLSVSPKDVKRAVDLLNGFQGQLAAVLPGNHDFYSGTASALWSRFGERAGDRILLLRDPRVYDLQHYDLNVLLYAAPCDSKHGKTNVISRLQKQNPAREDPDALRIGVAHGSIEGISPDAQGTYFPMTREELDQAPVDLWVVGHTHRQHPAELKQIDPEAASGPLLLIPGTPEPDGFDCRHGGAAWMIEAGQSRRIRVESLATGTYRFIHEQIALESPGDLRRLEQKLRSAQMDRTLLRLKLIGRLDADQIARLRQLQREAEQSSFYAQIDASRLVERITERTVEAEFTRGSFPYRLLKSLIAERDFEALQTAYTLLQEQKR